MNTYTENTPSITDGDVRLFSWMKSCNFFKPFCNKRSKSVKPINRAIMKQEDIVIIDGVDTSNEHSKKIAAYALNLCTVSVSQIVDYNDIHVLEQEYEAILNNLNLENIPKDEALLRTLKQILDTITFFRIQEGDKKMLQKSYEQKVKNAIWNAVPNFGMIVGGSPITMAISVATMVGMGYMNYRREKAKINLENEQQLWQLQRSALEQFNALRRELFDTAWRLADKYQFPDNYRLTEKQISQYDEILMDPISLRRYQRLWNVRDYFEAFPPFWYYLGSAANSVHLEYNESNKEISAKFRNKAKEAFEHFLQIHDLDLLRIDQVRTSCDLEYADILYLEGERDNKILNLLEDAYNHSGRATDVLQLCAVKYIQLEQFERAQEILLELIVENSNTSTNAFLLNRIYLCQIQKNESLYYDYQKKYNVLQALVPEINLLPWPSLEEIQLPEKDTEVFNKKQNEIRNTINNALQHLAERYELLLKKAILFIPPFEQCPDDIYSYGKSTERQQKFNVYIADETNLREFQQLLHGDPIRLRVYNRTEEYINDLIDFYEQVVLTSRYGNDRNKADNARIKSRMKLNCKVTDEFTNRIIKLDEDILKHIDFITNTNNNEHFSIDYYNKMDDIDVWKMLLEPCKEELGAIIEEDINKCKKITSLTEIGEKLETYCINHGFELHQHKSTQPTLVQGDQHLIAKFKVEDCKRILETDKQIEEIIKKHQSLIQKNDETNISFHDDKINSEILQAANGDYIIANITLKGKTVMCFTRTGVIAKLGSIFKNWKKVRYVDIEISDIISSKNEELSLSKDKNLNEDLTRLCAELKEKFKI